MVADTTDEESNLPEDPLDLDEEMVIPQRPGIQDLYEKTAKGHHRQQKSKDSTATASPAPASSTATTVQPDQVAERVQRMADAESHATVRSRNLMLLLYFFLYPS